MCVALLNGVVNAANLICLLKLKLLTADGEAGPRRVDAELVLGPALVVAVVGALAVDHRQRRLHALHLDLKFALGVLVRFHGFIYRSMQCQLSRTTYRCRLSSHKYHQGRFCFTPRETNF